MSTRRRFLHRLAVGTAAATSPGWLPQGLAPLTWAETQLGPEYVRFADDIEPTVRLLEQTPREQLLEQIASRIKQGSLTYRQVIAALMLAGIRNVQPRPHVGFKFHTVLVVNSAHLASMNSPDTDRWLPIFWALDYFKSAQAADVEQGDWTMPAVAESKLPPLRKARFEFEQAMDDWDAERADAAIASLARGASENELFELMARYGCRDFRDIGHKAIFVANAFRTLACIGWRHAPAILRSLTYALQCRGSDPHPARNDLPADRPEKTNRDLARSVSEDWLDGSPDSSATKELQQTLHEGGPQVAQAVADQLAAGVAAQSIYDALFVSAGEMLMRQPGIVALHAVTMTNALGYAYRRVSKPQLRLKILLQNASFLSMFLDRMRQNSLSDKSIRDLNPSYDTGPPPKIDEILQLVGRDNDQAAADVLRLLQHDSTSATSLIDAARRQVFFKGTNSHDYKFSSAVLEDYFNISPEWRNYYLATGVYKLRGAAEPDTRLLSRIRSVLASSP